MSVTQPGVRSLVGQNERLAMHRGRAFEEESECPETAAITSNPRVSSSPSATPVAMPHALDPGHNMCCNLIWFEKAQAGRLPIEPPEGGPHPGGRLLRSLGPTRDIGVIRTMHW